MLIQGGPEAIGFEVMKGKTNVGLLAAPVGDPLPVGIKSEREFRRQGSSFRSKPCSVSYRMTSKSSGFCGAGPPFVL